MSDARWLAVVYSHLGSGPLLAIIPKCKVPGEAVTALAELHGYLPGTVHVGSRVHTTNPEGEWVIQILKWEEVPA